MRVFFDRENLEGLVDAKVAGGPFAKLGTKHGHRRGHDHHASVVAAPKDSPDQTGRGRDPVGAADTRAAKLVDFATHDRPPARARGQASASDVRARF